MTIQDIYKAIFQMEALNIGDTVILIGLPEHTVSQFGVRTANPMYQLHTTVTDIQDDGVNVKVGEESAIVPHDNCRKQYNASGWDELKGLKEKVTLVKVYNRLERKYDLPTGDVLFEWEPLDDYLSRKVESWRTKIPKLNVSYLGETIIFEYDQHRDKLYPTGSIWSRRTGYTNLDTIAKRAKEYISEYIARNKYQEEQKTASQEKSEADTKALSAAFPSLTVGEAKYGSGIRATTATGEIDYFNRLVVTTREDGFRLNLDMDLTAEQINAILAIVETD
jgi:hypothetical protein